jgi:prepilin-type processing-associated H-X9-DG protein
MNPRHPRDTIQGMTLIEVLVIIVAVVALAFLLLPISRPGYHKSAVVHCMSNLRQIGMAESMWADDHKSDFPALVSTNRKGTLEFLANGRVDLHFQGLAAYLLPVEVFHCPADQREPATNYADLKNMNISYFASLDAGVSNSASFLAGDRDLMMNGVPAPPGLATLTSTNVIGWTKELHYQTTGERRGNAVFPDGHVELMRENELSGHVKQIGTNVNRLVFP